jgi:hypothetical protein
LVVWVYFLEEFACASSEFVFALSVFLRVETSVVRIRNDAEVNISLTNVFLVQGLYSTFNIFSSFHEDRSETIVSSISSFTEDDGGINVIVSVEETFDLLIGDSVIEASDLDSYKIFIIVYKRKNKLSYKIEIKARYLQSASWASKSCGWAD